MCVLLITSSFFLSPTVVLCWFDWIVHCRRSSFLLLPSVFAHEYVSLAEVPEFVEWLSGVDRGLTTKCYHFQRAVGLISDKQREGTYTQKKRSVCDSVFCEVPASTFQ